MRVDPSQLATSADVERAALVLLGDPLRTRPPLSRVAAVWAPGDGRNLLLAPGAATADGRTAPRSEVDRLVLNMSRGSAQAILSTGANLRAEPDLRFEFRGPEAPALMRWRVEVHGLLPPVALVLSRGDDLDPSHPGFKGPAKLVLLVPEERVADVKPLFRGNKWTKVHGHPSPSVPAAVEWLRNQSGAESISVEVGARAGEVFHDGTLRLDELLLSRYEGEDLDASFVVGELPSDDALDERMRCIYRTPVDADGWSFSRYVARD